MSHNTTSAEQLAAMKKLYSGTTMIQVTTQQLNSYIEGRQGFTLVDVFADWCAPCKRMTPVLDELDGEFPDLLILKINSDDEYEYAKFMEISSIPTLIMYDGDNEVARWEGGQDINEIREWIKEVTTV